MVDTVRPLATIQNLLADNTAGNIGAQDMRDVVLSLWSSTVPLWTDVAHVQGQLVRRPDGSIYQANDAVPLGTGFLVGTAGATWQRVVNGSGVIENVPQNRLLTVNASGVPVASSLEEQTDRIRTTKQIEAPGGGGIVLSNWEATAQGAIIGFEELASSTMYLPVASRLDSGGTTRPFYENLAAESTIASQANTSEEFATSASTHQFAYVNASRASVISFTIERPVGATAATECNLTIRLNSHTDADPLVDYQRDHPQSQTFTLGAGSTVVTLPSPGFFIENTTLFVTVESQAGDNLRLLGQTIDINPSGATNNQQVISFAAQGRLSTSVNLALESEIRSDEVLQDFIAAMFTGGSHNGISVNYDDINGVIDLTVTGGTPQPGESVSAFSINVPSTVNTGTDLNTARTVQFTTAGTATIASLTLVVTTGTDIALTVPLSDGSHSQSVTLAGIDTSNPGTVTFQIRGTTDSGATIMSNSQTVTVRTVTADEQAYYGTRATNDFATVATSGLTAVDVQPPGSQYTISGSWPNTHFVGILEPTDRPITSIIETAFNQETLSTWTRTASARTINGQTYDLLIQQNNSGSDGTFEFRVTHG